MRLVASLSFLGLLGCEILYWPSEWLEDRTYAPADPEVLRLEIQKQQWRYAHGQNQVLVWHRKQEVLDNMAQIHDEMAQAKATNSGNIKALEDRLAAEQQKLDKLHEELEKAIADSLPDLRAAGVVEKEK